MKVKLICSDPMCRIVWSIGVKVDVVGTGITVEHPPGATVTIEVTLPKRLPLECPSCGSGQIEVLEDEDDE